MSNGRFIVCRLGTDYGVGCADCQTPIAVDGERDADQIYICEACLPEHLSRIDEIDEACQPDEVEVTVDGPAPVNEAPTFEDRISCKDAADGVCICRWCKVVNPIADDLAAVIKKHKHHDKLTLVDAVARVLVEVGVVYQGGLGLWHRDALRVTGIVQARAMRVADRERTSEYDRFRPLVERAMAEAGIDLSELFKAIPQEPTH